MHCTHASTHTRGTDSTHVPPRRMREATPHANVRTMDGASRPAIAPQGATGHVGAHGTPVSYTHLRAHETSAHL
eukprot:12214610-Alexandrium_andersonii.AAC.1